MNDFEREMLTSQREQSHDIKQLTREVADIRQAQAVADTKHGLLGSLAGGATGGLTAILAYFFSRHT